MDLTPRSYATPARFTPDQRYVRLASEEGCSSAFDFVLSIPPAHLGEFDFAIQNMLCAYKLPGSENIDIPKCLTRLDNLTNFVKDTIDKNIHRRPPGSEAVWRMASLVTSVKRDFGVAYDPLIRENNAAGKHSDMSDSSKLFLHGLLGDDPHKRFGSCASLPALVVLSPDDCDTRSALPALAGTFSPNGIAMEFVSTWR